MTTIILRNDITRAGVSWSETRIAAALARQVFERKHLVIVPNCTWPGSECDLLVVTRRLQIIDIEIKISRQDLKADAKKDKWFHNWDWRIDGPFMRHDDPEREAKRRRRDWPHRVWKHYYAVPIDVWKPELIACLPSSKSGVITIATDSDGRLVTRVEIRATPCREAEQIDASDAVDIARLASLRMWDALDRIHLRDGSPS